MLERSSFQFETPLTVVDGSVSLTKWHKAWQKSLINWTCVYHLVGDWSDWNECLQKKLFAPQKSHIQVILNWLFICRWHLEFDSQLFPCQCNSLLHGSTKICLFERVRFHTIQRILITNTNAVISVCFWRFTSARISIAKNTVKCVVVWYLLWLGLFANKGNHSIFMQKIKTPHEWASSKKNRL